ncbi:MAG: hypothetical protein IJC25_02310 [Clostridia bacterium]|nr:hypothetical protein [Clostridia bacterium]
MNKSKKQIPEFNSSLLCIDRYSDGVPVGRFYDAGTDREIHFCSLSQLLLIIDRSAQGMEVSPRPLHSFGSARLSNRSFDEIRFGAAATFSLRILFRQNASWQGSVTWLDGKIEQSFRSALELIFLLDGVLSNLREVSA